MLVHGGITMSDCYKEDNYIKTIITKLTTKFILECECE